VIPKRVSPRLILDEPTVRSSLMVVFLENKVIAVTGLSELSLLVWIPIHGQELSCRGTAINPGICGTLALAKRP
jgi:hypothetical protein